MQVFQEDSAPRVATLPTLDEYGLLWRQDKWVALSPIEERLIKAFLAEPGRVINRNVLGHAGWPGGAPNVRSVDARIKALRRRVEPLAVRIHTVRGHGYLADFNPRALTASVRSRRADQRRARARRRNPRTH